MATIKFTDNDERLQVATARLTSLTSQSRQQSSTDSA